MIYKTQMIFEDKKKKKYMSKTTPTDGLNYVEGWPLQQFLSLGEMCNVNF